MLVSHYYKIPTAFALLAVAVILASSIAASVVFPQKKPQTRNG
jgi:hypothetical protein